MAEKLKVSKQFAVDLQDLINDDYPKATIIEAHIGKSNNWNSHQSLNGVPLDDLCKALYVGYEVEETMEDKLGKIFKRTEQQKNYSDSEVRLILLEALEVVGLNVPEDYWMYN